MSAGRILSVVGMCVLLWAGPVHGGDFKVFSPAFDDGGGFPLRFVMPAAGGRNLSIPLRWEGVPQGTRSLALILVDPHPVARNWVHWVVADIPPDVDGLPEGASGKAMPKGSREAVNSFGFPGYGGPQPPPGTGDHPYVVYLYALDVPHLNLPERPSWAVFQEAVKGHVLGVAKFTGYFGR